MNVRRALPSDVPGIVALHRNVIAEGTWFVSTPGESVRSLDRWRSDLVNTLFLVAPSPLGLSGWVRIRPGPYQRNRHVGYLDLMVAAEERGRGVGRALMAAGLGAALEDPSLRKLALCVYADNARAITLYEAFGFVQEGRRIAEYLREGQPVDDLIMGRQLR